MHGLMRYQGGGLQNSQDVILDVRRDRPKRIEQALLIAGELADLGGPEQLADGNSEVGRDVIELVQMQTGTRRAVRVRVEKVGDPRRRLPTIGGQPGLGKGPITEELIELGARALRHGEPGHD